MRPGRTLRNSPTSLWRSTSTPRGSWRPRRSTCRISASYRPPRPTCSCRRSRRCDRWAFERSNPPDPAAAAGSESVGLLERMARLIVCVCIRISAAITKLCSVPFIQLIRGTTVEAACDLRAIIEAACVSGGKGTGAVLLSLGPQQQPPRACHPQRRSSSVITSNLLTTTGANQKTRPDTRLG